MPNLSLTITSVFHRRVITIAIFFIFSMVLAWILTPSAQMSNQRKDFDINKIVPKEFDDWKVYEGSALVVDPELKRKVESVYSQTLSRTYKNSKNQIIMLSVAYGGNQQDMMQVHRPEVCYVAQGFDLKQIRTSEVSTVHGKLKAKLLLAKQAERIEPITYWIKIGDSIAVDGITWRIERIKYGLSGSVPDGLLFRVSSIGNDIEEQYHLQSQFIQALAKSLTSEQFVQILGKEQLN